MAETAELGLPLLAPAQSQKHVTVNEALARLDALVNLRLASVGAATPPVNPGEGEVHGVGDSATGDWAGQEGRLALFLNGGWAFLTPGVGWQGWSVSDGSRVAFDGAEWQPGAGAISPNGAGFLHRVIELDHALAAGAFSSVTGALPANTVVYGITGRVLTAIGGATSLRIGVAGSDDRYGSGIGTGTGAWARGITGSPLAYYADTDLMLTAEGGSFDGSGVVRLAVHLAELTLPRG